MKIILGIDPGSRVTGYGIIAVEDKNLLKYIDSGCIKTSNGELYQKLLEIFNGICEIMEQHRPTEAAIEQVFMHQNVNAALKLGHARGVAMAACATHRLRVAEYAPRVVKQTLVGFGGAKKEQVKHMVVNILNLAGFPQEDAADALAIAICHHHFNNAIGFNRRNSSKRGLNDWLVKGKNFR